jgi:hypothetical protein
MLAMGRSASASPIVDGYEVFSGRSLDALASRVKLAAMARAWREKGEGGG